MHADKLIPAIAALSKTPLATASELKVLREFQSKWESLQSARTAAGYEAARKTFKAQAPEFAKLALKNPESLAEIVPQAREKIQSDFAVKRRAVRAAIIELWGGVPPACEPILRRFCEHAERVAADLEKAERAAYERLGVPYEQSPLGKYVRECIPHLQAALKSNVPVPAVELLHGIVTL